MLLTPQPDRGQMGRNLLAVCLCICSLVVLKI